MAPSVRANEPIALPFSDYRTRIMRCSAVAATLGGLLFIATDIAAIALAKSYSLVSGTISALAVGRYAWVQDVGIDAFAVSFVALALGLLYWRPVRQWVWLCSVMFLVLSGIATFLIAQHHVYGPYTPAMPIHAELVAVLFITTALALIGVARNTKRAHSGVRLLTLLFGIPFCVLGVPYFFMPERIEGAYERFLVALVLMWTLGISYFLLRLSRTHTPP